MYWKTRVRGEKFHNISFSSKNKAYERIDVLITASVNIYQTKKKYSNMMKQFWNPLFLREPPFQLTCLSLSNFFITPIFVRIEFQKQETPRLLGWRKLWRSFLDVQREGLMKYPPSVCPFVHLSIFPFVFWSVWVFPRNRW